MATENRGKRAPTLTPNPSPARGRGEQSAPSPILTPPPLSTSGEGRNLLPPPSGGRVGERGKTGGGLGRGAAGQREHSKGANALTAEFAHRLRDPFETSYMGVLRTADPLLLEKGHGSVDLYRDLRRDGKVFAGLQKRQLALIGKSWQVEPRELDDARARADAELVTQILKGFAFDKLCADLLQALITGFTVAEIVWTVKDGLIVPDRMLSRAQKRFVYVQTDAQTPARLHLLVRENMLTGIPVPDRKFIVHRVNPEDDNPYGTGLGLQLFWPVYFKRQGVVAWNKLNDRFGAPTPHGKWPRGASEKEKSTLVDALRAMSNDGYLATPEGMSVELLESRLAGNVTTQQQLCEYMDDWIAEVLTGQESSRSGGGGALAAASKERQNVRQDLTQADSDLLSETLNSTLLAWICELNGLAPCQVWRQIQEESDQKTLAEADKAVYDMGFELSEDVVRARYGEGWSRRANAGLAPLPDPPPTGGGKLDFAERERDATPTFLPPRPLGGEGWGEGASPAPGRPPPNFAERDAAPTLLLPRPLQGAEGWGEGVDALSDPLDATSASIIGQWLAQLRAAVNAHDDPAQLQDALLAQFGALPERDLTELMALAFELAHLKGREAALTDNSPLPSPPPQGGGSGDGGSVLLPPPSSPPAPLHFVERGAVCTLPLGGEGWGEGTNGGRVGERGGPGGAGNTHG